MNIERGACVRQPLDVECWGRSCAYNCCWALVHGSLGAIGDTKYLHSVATMMGCTGGGHRQVRWQTHCREKNLEIQNEWWVEDASRLKLGSTMWCGGDLQQLNASLQQSWDVRMSVPHSLVRSSSVHGCKTKRPFSLATG